MRQEETGAGGRLDLFDLEGKVAFITGAAGLLGGVHAEALARHGADIVLTDLETEKCEQRAKEIEGKFGVKVMTCVCDVTRESSWKQALGQAERAFQRVDVLINNAGSTNATRSAQYDAAFEVFPLADWRDILDVNLTGTFLGCQVAGAKMLAQGSGSIINMASLYGVVSPHHPLYEGTGVSQPAAYSVSKAGVLGLTRYLGALWAGRGIRVNAITPGGIFDRQSSEFVGFVPGVSASPMMKQKGLTRAC